MQNLITKKRKTKGFTLVELVIVIVIIGILAGIAGMAYSNVTQGTKDAVAKANLRSVKSAIMLYSTQNTGSFPTALTDADLLKLLENDVKNYVNSTAGTPGADYTYSWDSGTGELSVTGGGLPSSASEADGTLYKLK